MADKKRRAPLPPTIPPHGTQTGGNPFREISNPAYVEAPQQSKKLSLPLPDYDTLFPQKRHGVQGHTRWDHIIAEVNQKHREAPPDFLGPEMSVDGPEEPVPSLPQEAAAISQYQPQPQDVRPMSSKKSQAPTPPKSALLPPRSTDSSERWSQNSPQSIKKPNPIVAPAPLNHDSPSTESLTAGPKDGARKVLYPSPATRNASQMDLDTKTADDQTNVQVNKEAPTAKPRQRVSGKEPVQQEDSAVTSVVPDKQINGNIQTSSSSSLSSTNKNGRPTKESVVEFDPFPSTDLLSKDPWAHEKQKKEMDDLFKGRVQKEQKPEERGITVNDLDSIFSQEKPADPFASLNSSESDKHSRFNDKDEDLKQESPVFQRRNSQRRNQSLPATGHSDNKTSKSRQEPPSKEQATVNQGLSVKEVSKLQPNVKTQSPLYGREDPFGAEPFTVTSPEPLQVVLEEPEPQAGGLTGGKMPLRAWVSPSDVQSVSAQNNNGGGLSFIPRRPHPVKPMSTADSKHVIAPPALKEIKVRDTTTGKIQVADSVESGPYTQLTQEELITLVVKQQTDLSRKDAKIVELEEYIDNLLVRVIDEKPSILHSLNSKPV